MEKIQPADFYPLFWTRWLWVIWAPGYETRTCLSALLMDAWWDELTVAFVSLQKIPNKISCDGKSQMDRDMLIKTTNIYRLLKIW